VVGLLDDYRLSLRPGFPEDGLAIYLLGATRSEVGGSEYAEVVLGKVTGRPPSLDLEAEAGMHRLLVELARRDVLASCHDLSEGGLAVALAECAISGATGFQVVVPEAGFSPWVTLYSESASRALVTARRGQWKEVESAAAAGGVPLARIGLTGGTRLRFTDLFEVELSDALVVYEGAIPRLMAAERLPG
jgi:phosphoribosylformylglycinamidine synthase